MFLFVCKRKLIKSHLNEGEKMVLFNLALGRPENLLASKSVLIDFSKTNKLIGFFLVHKSTFWPLF